MADLLWYNAATNRLSVWLMRGTEPRERGPELPGPPGDGWMCVPALDYNLDGMEDLLWYNPVTNRLSVWLMRGTEPFERGPEIPGLPAAAGSPPSAAASIAAGCPESSGSTRRRTGRRSG